MIWKLTLHFQVSQHLWVRTASIKPQYHYHNHNSIQCTVCVQISKIVPQMSFIAAFFSCLGSNQGSRVILGFVSLISLNLTQSLTFLSSPLFVRLLWRWLLRRIQASCLIGCPTCWINLVGYLWLDSGLILWAKVPPRWSCMSFSLRRIRDPMTSTGTLGDAEFDGQVSFHVLLCN